MLNRYYSSAIGKIIISLIFVLSFVTIQAVAFSSVAKAAVPYTYTLNKTMDGNIITLNFDSGMTVNSVEASQIPIKAAIRTTDDVELMKPLAIKNIVKVDSNTVAITVSDLDPKMINYEMKLEPGVINFDSYIQLITFTIPFSSSEFGYSFGDVFLTRSNEDYINDNILEYNETEDVNVYIPKKYITKVETTHKYQGGSSSGKDNLPELTGINILTDVDVKKLIVDITDKDGNSLMAGKILVPRNDIKGFNFGQTALNIKKSIEYNVNIKAYDFYGKLLEQTSIIPRVKDKDKDFIINDYINSKATSFKADEDIILYDLMKNKSTLNSILESFINNPNSIKILCNNTKDYRAISVDDYEDTDDMEDALNDLIDALNDYDVKYIKFEKRVPLEAPYQGLKITGRNIKIEGNGSKIKGNITVGRGASDINIYDIRNIKVDGDLIIRKSTAGGECRLVDVEATNIIMED